MPRKPTGNAPFSVLRNVVLRLHLTQSANAAPTCPAQPLPQLVISK